MVPSILKNNPQVSLPRSKRVNYLSNKELLKEIALSKNSFCMFTSDKYIKYDIILQSLDDLTPEKLLEAKEQHVLRINDERLQKLIDSGLPKNEAQKKVSLLKIKEVTRSDLVIRIMTDEHIPQEIRENKRKLVENLAFKPFKQYTFSKKRHCWYEVARSHWEGNFTTGHFAKKGKMTDKLVRSIILLTERYASRANYRNYTYVQDMMSQAFLQLALVALQFDELRSNNPFAFYTQCVKTSFLKILKDEKKVRDIRDEILSENNQATSATYQIEHSGCDND